MNPPNQMFADGGCSGDGEGDLQELEQHGAQPLQERHHLVQGQNNHLVQGEKNHLVQGERAKYENRLKIYCS